MARSAQISIVMSAYNAEPYLREAIDSILGQTFRNFEFIIINDGSNDRTDQIIRSYSDDRIIYHVNEKNLGLIESLNKGLHLAKGQYIARIDADDVALPNRLEIQYEAFEKYHDAIVIGTDYFSLSNKKLTLVKNVNDSDYQKVMLLFATCFCHPTVMIKNVHERLKIYYHHDFLHTEDYKLWTDLSFHGNFYNVATPLLKYRSHNTQVSSVNRAKQLKVSDQVRRQYLQRLGFHFSEEQFIIHSLIGNNEFIRSTQILSEIEKWLLELQTQNRRLKKFNEASFNKAIHKFWLDSCGNTKLGLQAFKSYFNSPLSALATLSSRDTFRLAGKCLLRKYRH